MKFTRCLTAVLLVGGVACQSDNPTVPDIVLPETASTPVPVEVEPQIITAPQATPGELPLWVKCNQATGVCTFGTDKPRPVDAVCTYPGENHPIWGTWNAVINDGDTVSAVDICTEVPGVDEERCVPITKPVQVDFHGMGRHIGHLGPLYNLTFPATLSPEECDECREEPVIEVGPWSDCEPFVVFSTGDNGAGCQRTRTVTTIFCDEGRHVEVEMEPCECVCVETGPHEGETVWGSIQEGSCPETFSALTGEKCHQDGTQTTTWDCREPTESSVCRPAECPNGCVIPEAGTTLSFHGPANCEAECEAFGDYECSDNGADFWICKAGNDRIAEHEFPDGDTCRNGKDVSHVRACVCEDDD